MPLVLPDALLAGTGRVRPSMTVWSRLEPDPSAEGFAESLAAPLADPLWLLARQWQLGEFAGEDAGSPVEAQASFAAVPLAGFRAGAAGAARGYAAALAPLEPLVEAEDPALSGLLDGARAGHHFLQIAADAGLTHPFREFPGFALRLPAHDDSDPSAADWLALLAGRAIDGHRLAAAIALARGVPAGLAIPAARRDEARALCLAWLDWYRGSVPGPYGQSWDPGRLGHAFAVEAAGATLACPRYPGGRLDWYHFDAAGAPPAMAQAAVLPARPTLLAPVRFSGMPADRYWEIEDSRINFAEVEAGPTDLARMMLLEFALTYGNDWFVLPLTLPAGAIVRLATVVVRDTFGIETVATPLRDPHWRMFELSGADGLFLAPPALVGAIEGEPREEAALLRDEIANLAWGVERRVQGALGPTVEPTREAVRVPVAPGPPIGDRISADHVYRLATPVPENWLPFVPVQRGAGLALERRALLRHRPGGTVEPDEPRGQLLRTRAVLDEELPVEGLRLERRTQFARWVGGERLLWTGARAIPGTSEASPGLRFDVRLDRAGPADKPG